MSHIVKTIEATDAPSLVTAVNTFLATLVNPTIRFVDYLAFWVDKRMGTQYTITITYDTGGQALATPFLLRIDEDINLAALLTTLNAAYAANAYFWAGTRWKTLDRDSIKIKRYSAATFYNTTLAAGANNWLPQ